MCAFVSDSVFLIVFLHLLLVDQKSIHSCVSGLVGSCETPVVSLFSLFLETASCVFLNIGAGGDNLSPYLFFQRPSAAKKEFLSLSWANGPLCRFSVFLLHVF